MQGCKSPGSLVSASYHTDLPLAAIGIYCSVHRAYKSFYTRVQKEPLARTLFLLILVSA